MTTVNQGTVEATVKVNVADVAPNTRRGGDIRLTLSPRTVGCTSGFGGVLILAPDEFVTEHFHPYSEEFLHVIEGQLTLTLDDVPVALDAGDSILVRIGVRHRLVNVGTKPARVVFHLSPLAPRPELGHVDTEQPVAAQEPNPQVGAPEVGGDT